jgi:hypothetical protein
MAADRPNGESALRRGLLTAAAAAAAVLALPLVFAATGSDQADASPVTAIGGSCTVAPPPAPGQPGPDRIELTPDQVANARTIAGVARGQQLPERAAAIALMTAMQESTLTNVNHGDLAGPTSRGLFQQKPEFYPDANVMDPASAAAAFYRRLVQLPDYLTMPMWQAAQAVQRSADGSLYQKWQVFGTVLAASLYGGASDQVSCTGGNPDVGPDSAASTRIQAVLTAAQSQLGKPYVWGGGDANGPTGGADHVSPPGYDCSGLVIFAWARVGVSLPHSSRAQYDAGQRLPLSQARAGDLIFLATNTATPASIHHVAIVFAPGQIIEAQDFGVPVHIRPFAGASEPEIMPEVVRLAP